MRGSDQPAPFHTDFPGKSLCTLRAHTLSSPSTTAAVSRCERACGLPVTSPPHAHMALGEQRPRVLRHCTACSFVRCSTRGMASWQRRAAVSSGGSTSRRRPLSTTTRMSGGCLGWGVGVGGHPQRLTCDGRRMWPQDSRGGGVGWGGRQVRASGVRVGPAC